MVELQQFAYGWVTPVLSYAISSCGFLLGVLLTSKARNRRGLRRLRLVSCAAVAIGAVGIWLCQVFGLLGAHVPDSTIRIHPVLAAASLACVTLLVGAGLFVANYAQPGLRRSVLTFGCFVAGLTCAHALLVKSIQVAGTIHYDPTVLAVADQPIIPHAMVLPGLIAMVAALGTLRVTTALRSLQQAVLAAVLLAMAVGAMHYTGMLVLRVRLDGGASGDLVGAEPMLLFGPVVLLGVAGTAMLAYFTFGRSTMADLRAIYTRSGRRIEIEPWLIDEVTKRVVLGHTDAAQPGDAPQSGNAPQPGQERPSPVRRPPGPRPTPGITPIWRTMPRWGSANSSASQKQMERAPTNVALPAPLAPARSDQASALRPNRYPPTAVPPENSLKPDFQSRSQIN